MTDRRRLTRSATTPVGISASRMVISFAVPRRTNSIGLRLTSTTTRTKNKVQKLDVHRRQTKPVQRNIRVAR